MRKIQRPNGARAAVADAPTPADSVTDSADLGRLVREVQEKTNSSEPRPVSKPRFERDPYSFD